MGKSNRSRLVRPVSARPAADPSAHSFGGFVNAAQRAGHLVVQPRMGMSDPQLMRSGLQATRQAKALTVGTITLDSYTRLGSHEHARQAVADGVALNGYPIVAHGTATTLWVIDGIAGPDFPVQVRHGAPSPYAIFEALMAAGLAATEGGPVSYCLPYSRNPLERSVADWARSCEMFARLRESGAEPHLETFGGCMMGQLCPPSLLIALAVLEALFFQQHGLRSVSLSYAQQTNAAQDEEALNALARIAGELLDPMDWHIVLYAYMGVYPRTSRGAELLLEDAARLAVRTGAARLIVKTAAEAHRIPNVAENVAALETAARAAANEPGEQGAANSRDTGILDEARAIIDAVVALDPSIGSALVQAFRVGLLDVPYCLHPDNAGRTRSFLDSEGWLHWGDTGSMPVRRTAHGSVRLSSAALLDSLSYVERKFDQLALAEATFRKATEHRAPRPVLAAPAGVTDRTAHEKESVS
ncbi:methylaspartate mutase [Streptomyces sp. DSM 41014]|uniref:Methylaspartate mutase n=1 Tax=Streptomyces hintoniae TaxID=3075521 RepID=A0ABU2UWV3_9ACTN|nr:methylaspartate mutase [Streptomyces sp. DSM 41014]MDT0477782.1 methylaspartate mutase [Streptomyces sp. DSM 41014]